MEWKKIGETLKMPRSQQSWNPQSVALLMLRTLTLSYHESGQVESIESLVFPSVFRSSAIPLGWKVLEDAPAPTLMMNMMNVQLFSP